MEPTVSDKQTPRPAQAGRRAKDLNDNRFLALQQKEPVSAAADASRGIAKTASSQTESVFC